jgi:hypothetical protein
MIGSWGTLDHWGDYELLFRAAKLDLRIVGQSYVLQRFRTRPLPIELKPLAMPGDGGLRFDDDQCRLPVVPQLPEPNPQDAVAPTAGTLQGPRVDGGGPGSLLAKRSEVVTNLAGENTVGESYAILRKCRH